MLCLQLFELEVIFRNILPQIRLETGLIHYSCLKTNSGEAEDSGCDEHHYILFHESLMFISSGFFTVGSDPEAHVVPVSISRCVCVCVCLNIHKQVR